MSRLRLVLALHNHQPIGNFGHVFAEAYRTSYEPFLDVLEGYPSIAFTLHTSGPLLEWLVMNRPEYIARLRAMVSRGQVEILGGGFYEPILTMIPHRDRVGQIRSYAAHLEHLLGQPIRGMWVPERVWEPHLVSSIVDAGMEFVVLDDSHFLGAGLPADQLRDYYLTEDEGKLLKVFPNSERLRYLIPFHEPHAAYEHLRRLAEERPGSVVVCADDGEKFGSWPETFDHVYTKGWLRHFCDMLSANAEWVETTHLGRTLDSVVPAGKVYIPAGSYREMTEWALTTDRAREYAQARRSLDARQDAEAGAVKSFFAPGGFWRNFKVKYPETDEMYARMLEVSKKIEAAESRLGTDRLTFARDHLYRAQCNCSYWHGSFGGLYLPHLRHAVFEHLIAAEKALELETGRPGWGATLDVDDFDLDARKEIRLSNERFVAYVRPSQGGQIYELDLREFGLNALATITRRPEPYHDLFLSGGDASTAAGEPMRLKESGLDELLSYDRWPRKWLVDHWFDLGETAAEAAAGRARDVGDFASGAYLSEVSVDEKAARLIMRRLGRVADQVVRATKTIELEAERGRLHIGYEFEGLPTDREWLFAPELNISGLAGEADDRFYLTALDEQLGRLDTRLDLERQGAIRLVDCWRDLDLSLSWSSPARVWTYPVQTVSQSEGGVEGVYQSSCVMPVWSLGGSQGPIARIRIVVEARRYSSRVENGSQENRESSRERVAAEP